jgi:serine/threonine-protein kinase
MSGDQIGNFRIIGRLGEGGMGEVFRAMDTMLEREVALKTLRPELSAREELVERFRVDHCAGKLHRDIARCIRSSVRTTTTMAMRFVRAGTRTAAHRAHRLDWKEARRSPSTCCRRSNTPALGVIHRDLKPANLMLDPSGRTVVMDFGIARVLARAPDRAGNLVGTLHRAGNHPR